MKRRNVNHRVLRGGCCVNDVIWFLRVTFRFRNEPKFLYKFYGFRFVVRGTK
jgi:formylglycine-generating enzyme required for sulfatase activity